MNFAVNKKIKMMKKNLVAAMIILALFATSCKTVVSTNKTPKDMVEMVNNSEPPVVDVRMQGEFEQKTAKNAVNIP